MPNKAEKIIVAQSEEGIRLDRWFHRHYPSLPHSKLQQLLRKGAVQLNDSKTTAATRIQSGQVVQVPLFSQEEIKKAAPLSLTNVERAALLDRVLYKNDELIAFNKPRGLAVQGGTGQGRHLDGLLDALCFDSEERPRLVHRLDKETSGLLLLARSVRAAAKLASFFKNQQVNKTYWALLVGVPRQKEGVIKTEIEERVAETHYQVVDQAAQRFSWVEFTPKTGKKHQLRLHALELGCAVLGDRRYGKPDSFFGARPHLHLHARAMVLPSGQAFTAPLPPHMQESFDTLFENIYS